MKISRPKVPQLQAGRSAQPYGGAGARSVGQIRSGHWTLGVRGGGNAPNFSRRGGSQVNSSATDRRKKSGKMF